MLCPHCEGAEDVFGTGFAKRDLKEYHQKGASKSTGILLDMLKKLGVEGKSLLDIGVALESFSMNSSLRV